MSQQQNDEIDETPYDGPIDTEVPTSVEGAQDTLDGDVDA